MEILTIGKVAERANVGVETIRFYQREGLIAKPPRPTAGYREYPADIVRRIRFIRRAKELGFSLKEIRELLQLRVASGTTCDEVRQRADAKITDIENRIRSLRHMKKSLNSLASVCPGSGPVQMCPILEAIEDAESS